MNKYASCDYYAFVGQLNLHRIQDKYGNIFKIFENQLEYLKTGGSLIMLKTSSLISY